ncbi:extracellular solute-binding protein [Cohnella sp. CBP 2801]|uniref:Extracellular solute-binding protein n=2 Tax=Cohnella zeiphila TaxID=2761120 RepID=A0A7X0SRH1_9BACL|nr:extracellular solute-binding protein [Cohnella zeiphila]MBB6734746.1 extracellular solute-binding protein [Cohnella zeiphila]
MTTILSLLPLLVLAGCATKQSDDAQSTGSSSASKPVSLSIFAAQDSTRIDYPSQPFTKWVEDQTGVKIDWQTVPSTDTNVVNEKKQLALASGDIPDVFMSGFSKAEEQNYGSQGVLIPLNDLIDQYAPNIKKAMEDIPYLKGQMTAPDGNIYGIPSINECYHCSYGQKMWINKDWLAKLGLQMPTTTAEFEQVLKAFKENDPNGNGKQDEIALSGFQQSWNGNVDGFLMNAFVPDDNTYFFTVNHGKVDLAANKPEWKQGLEYMHRLFTEGLIDQGAFTQNNDAFVQLANHPGDNIIGAYTAGHLGMGPSVTEGQDRWKEYEAVPPLKGPNGAQFTTHTLNLGDGTFAITNKASKEQAIAAIKLADFMYTEPFATNEMYGMSGEYVRPANPGEKDTMGRQAKYTETPENGKVGELRDGWGQIGPALRTKDYRFSFTVPENPYTLVGYEYLLTLSTQKYEGFEPKEAFPQSLFIDPEDAENVQHFQTDINKYIQESMVQFIMGNKDLNKDWNSYVEGFNKLNLPTYVQIMQKAYDSYKQNG